MNTGNFCPSEGELQLGKKNGDILLGTQLPSRRPKGHDEDDSDGDADAGDDAGDGAGDDAGDDAGDEAAAGQGPADAAEAGGHRLLLGQQVRRYRPGSF